MVLPIVTMMRQSHSIYASTTQPLKSGMRIATSSTNTVCESTFYITRFTMLEDDQIEKLHALESDGHSIQFHSTFHERAAQYLETHTIDEYIENEVFIGLDAMRAAGFNPVSFAYPGGSHTPSLDAVCLTIFETLRVSDREGPSILYSVGIDNNSIESVVANPPEIMHAHRITDEDSDYAISRAELEYLFQELISAGYRFDVITNRD